MAQEPDDIEKEPDPVDQGPPHFRMVVPGQASKVLKQPIFDPDKVVSKVVEAPVWHGKKNK